MRIIYNPTEEQLKRLQTKLSKEQDLGIIDIHGPLVSSYIGFEDGGELIGVASISPYGSGTVELYKLYIAPEYRREGLGNQLLKETLNFLAENKIKEVFVETTPQSRGFWERKESSLDISRYSDNKFCINLTGD